MRVRAGRETRARTRVQSTEVKNMTGSEQTAAVTSGLAAVQSRIAEAARSAGRDPATVALVAVTKTHGRDRIEPVLQAGHRLFGENRVQEAQAKWPELRQSYAGIELHLIGPL